MAIKQITLPFNHFVDLSIGDELWIKIPLDLGILIAEIDKDQSLTYVEFPNKENHNSITKLWHIKAWRVSELNYKKAKEESAIRILEWNNLQTNIKLVANRMSEITLLPPSSCISMAQDILRKNPLSLDGLNIKLVHPYYKGVYTNLPFRPPLDYRE